MFKYKWIYDYDLDFELALVALNTVMFEYIVILTYMGDDKPINQQDYIDSITFAFEQNIIGMPDLQISNDVFVLNYNYEVFPFEENPRRIIRLDEAIELTVNQLFNECIDWS